MTDSPNLGLNLQTTGSNNGTWGLTLNTNQSIVDSRLGSRLTKSVAGSSNVVVTSSEAQNFIQSLTGVLTGNIKYILPAQGGIYFIKNGTTGSFLLTVVNDAAGTGIVIAQGASQLVVSNPDTITVSSPISNFTTLSATTLTATTINGATISTTNGTLTLANGSTLATSGANSITLTSSGTTNITLPTSGTIITNSSSDTLINKTIVAGNNTISGITEAMQTLADNTTNNVSTSKHGYTPKLPNDATKFLDGTGAYSAPAVPIGSVVAVSYAETSTYTTGTTVIPQDGTVPQVSEGTQVLTLSHTPASITNRLKITISIQGGSTTSNGSITAAVFSNASANALAARGFQTNNTAQCSQSISQTFIYTPATISALTITVRVGADTGGTWHINGDTSGFFGVAGLSTITVEEIKT